MSDETFDALMVMFGVGLGLYSLERLWTGKLRPWLDEQSQAIAENGLTSHHLFGSYDLMDAAGVAALAIPVLLIVVVAIRALTRSRRRTDSNETKEGR